MSGLICQSSSGIFPCGLYNEASLRCFRESVVVVGFGTQAQDVCLGYVPALLCNELGVPHEVDR